MTEQQIRQKVVDTIKGWLGRNEKAGTHKTIVDIYNSHTPLPRGYRLKYADAWCAGAVSAVAIHSCLTDIMPVECSCGAMLELYKNHPVSIWEENDAYIPAPGDVVFYDWNDSGKGDNTGAPEHVGIVVDVTDNSIQVIEGNYQDSVKTRTIAVNGKYIRGYGRPAYWSKATASDGDLDNTPADWERSAVDKAIKLELIQGDEHGNLRLHEPLTLARALVLFERVGLI
jgi:hypothetical protein